MEGEIRVVMKDAVREPEVPQNLLTALLDRFQEFGGVDLDLLPRDTPVRAATFEP